MWKNFMQRNQSSAPRGKGGGVNSVDNHRGADVDGKSDGRGRKEVRDLSSGSQNQKSSGGKGVKVVGVVLCP